MRSRIVRARHEQRMINLSSANCGVCALNVNYYYYRKSIPFLPPSYHCRWLSFEMLHLRRGRRDTGAEAEKEESVHSITL